MKHLFLGIAASLALVSAAAAAVPPIPPPAPYNAQTYDFTKNGGVCDGQDISNVSMTAASAVASSSSYTFTQADVGKYITVPGAGATKLSRTTPVNATIQSVSAGNATLSVSATNTVSPSASFTASIAGSTITVGGSPTGTLTVGQVLTGASGTNVPPNTTIVKLGTGTGGAGTYLISPGLTNNASGSYTSNEVATFGTSDTTAMTNLVSKINATANGGMIQLPAAKCIITDSVPWLSNVGMFGQGMHASSLKWIKTGDMTISMFADDGTDVAPIANVTMHDFEGDGIAATLTTYGSAAKFIQGKYYHNAAFHHLYLHDWPATCLGVDFITGGTFSQNYLVTCGRLNPGGATPGPGGAGIGIGTGGANTEEWTATGNVIQDPGSFGIFWGEGFGTIALPPVHIAVVGNVVSDFGTNSLHGGSTCIGDGGDRYANISGNVCYSAINANTTGIAVNGGTLNNAGAYGLHTSITSNTIFGYGNGVWLNYGTPTSDTTATHASAVIEANNIQGADLSCIKVTSPGTGSLDTVSVVGNTGYGCGTAGLEFSGTTAISTVKISDNTFENNGAVTATAANQAGILFSRTVTDLQITGNHLGDNLSGNQLYGISVATGVALTGVQMEGNHFVGNATAPMLMTGTLTGVLEGNYGMPAPTISGCSATSPAGNGGVGKYVSGTTGACTVVITPFGTANILANNGWVCSASDLNVPANLQDQSASTTSTCTITGTTVSADVVNFQGRMW